MRNILKLVRDITVNVKVANRVNSFHLSHNESQSTHVSKHLLFTTHQVTHFIIPIIVISYFKLNYKVDF